MSPEISEHGGLGKAMAAPEPNRVPEAMRSSYEAIVSLTDAFARERLNDEYVALFRRLAAQLARKRPSPLARGTIERTCRAEGYEPPVIRTPEELIEDQRS